MLARILFPCLALSAVGAWASAPVPKIALAVPTRHSKTVAADRKRILHSRWKSRVEPIFTPSEAAALSSMGDSELGLSLRLRLKSDVELKDFRTWARSHAKSFRLEIDPRVRATDDGLRPRQWGLENRGGKYSIDIDDFTRKLLPAVAGEDIGLKGAPRPTHSVIVAVLDSGVDVTHPDLATAIVRHEPECAALAAYKACVAKSGNAKCDPAFLVDHDGNGYPLDCQGWNLAGSGNSTPVPKSGAVLGDYKVNDEVGHGTHVAGIIAAQSNGLGVAGVAPLVKILPVRVLSGEPNEAIRVQENGLPDPREDGLHGGTGLGDVVARGILYALRSKAQVINMSLGWPDPLDSQLMRRMVDLAHAQGVLLVAAAGNDSTDSVILPCRYDGVICVGAHGPDGALTFFSNFGYGVDVLAPGWNILSTYPMNLLPLQFTGQIGYESKDGTSMSAPFVSGLLARLLGSGIAPNEAFARLMLGARHTRESQIEDPALFAESSAAGNADLAASYRVSAQALVLPAHKEPIRVEWDRASDHVAVHFDLADHWLDGQDVEIRIEPRSPSVRLELNRWHVPAWHAQEEKSFATNLTILDTRLESDLDFDVYVSGGNLAARTLRMRANIVVPILPNSSPGRQLPLVLADGRAVNRSYDEIRTVVTEDDSVHEFLGIRDQGSQGRALDLMTESVSSGQRRIVIRASLLKAADGMQVDSLQKIHDPANGHAVYALLETAATTAGPVRKASATQFSYLDENLKPLAGTSTKTVDPDVTYLAEDFQWQRYKGKLLPTWYGAGKIPALERKPYDPWKPKENTTDDFRIYFLGGDGLHSVALPKDYPQMVALLPQTSKQKHEGTVSMLLAKGDDYALEYGLAQLRDGNWSVVHPLALPVFHNLRGLVPAKIFSLDPAADFAGAAFSGYVASDVGPHGARRSTLVGTRGVADVSAETLRHFDVVADVAGSFVGASRVAQFSLTKYDIQYHDYTQRQAARSSQKRFSFLPTIFSVKSFFPLVAEDIKRQERLPALFVPGDFIFSKATQVFLPRYDESGKLAEIARPASFHLESGSGCTALPTARVADASGPAELLFFCGDHFVSVPVVF